MPVEDVKPDIKPELANEKIQVTVTYGDQSQLTIAMSDCSELTL